MSRQRRECRISGAVLAHAFQKSGGACPAMGPRVLAADVLYHFLHTGKTGGTAVKHAIGSLPVEARAAIRLHDHGVTLMMVPEEEKVIFTTRDPIDRFLSGFFSRKRGGKPRYNVAWTAGEKAAFTRF